MAQESLGAKQKRAAKILEKLKKLYPDAHCSLNYETPFQLLIATILSAQCTDERVNKVTPPLFKRFPGAKDMAKAPLAELEKLVQSTGFFRSKALSISTTAQALVEKHGGEVPVDQEKLTQLRGVGRKTANVVLGTAFGIPSVVVDTHVGRLSRRMGLTRQKDPEKVEMELMEVVIQKDWTRSNHLLIDHGRKICAARKPLCGECQITELCPKVGI